MSIKLALFQAQFGTNFLYLPGAQTGEQVCTSTTGAPPGGKGKAAFQAEGQACWRSPESSTFYPTLQSWRCRSEAGPSRSFTETGGPWRKGRGHLGPAQAPSPPENQARACPTSQGAAGSRPDPPEHSLLESPPPHREPLGAKRCRPVALNKPQPHGENSRSDPLEAHAVMANGPGASRRSLKN